MDYRHFNMGEEMHDNTNDEHFDLPPEQDAPPADNTADDNSAPPRDEAVPGDDARMGERLERLGGEPAPVITPEEFARLQKAGQVHIDSRGRVRTSRRSDAEAGVSLRKRRAWYG